MPGPAKATDPIEQSVSSNAQALDVLDQLPADHPRLKFWHLWADQVFNDKQWHQALTGAMNIAYARMALRNGRLSKNPRSYHNETHINDLLLRIIYCAKSAGTSLSLEGLAVLSFFAACHDLRQAEQKIDLKDRSLVGANEQASYLEAMRIIDLCGSDILWTSHHKLLLKTMIQGSTFGSGGKYSQYFFQGNLSKHLLEGLNLPNQKDEQLVLLACDVDTANVCLPLDQFAASAINIFDELNAHHDPSISAQNFFSQQQKTYFFEQQKFNAELTKVLFEPHKQANCEPLKTLSEHIAQLPTDSSAATIKAAFMAKAKELAVA